MVISISFCGMQRTLTQTDKIEIPLENNNTRVNDVLSYVRNEYPDLPLDEEMVLATVNQEVVSLNKKLRANDRVSFVPHIGGG